MSVESVECVCFFCFCFLVCVGIQNGGECWGGNTYGRMGAAQDCAVTNCPKIAPIFNSDDKCGGSYVNAVYRLTDAPKKGTEAEAEADVEPTYTPTTNQTKSHKTTQTRSFDFGLCVVCVWFVWCLCVVCVLFVSLVLCFCWFIIMCCRFCFLFCWLL